MVLEIGKYNLFLCIVPYNILINREDIALSVGQRTPHECRAHYNNFYLSTKSCLRTLVSQKIPEEPRSSGNGPKGCVIDNISATQLLLHNDERLLLSYFPLRDEFEQEWDQNAESLLLMHCSRPISENDLDVSLIEGYLFFHLFFSIAQCYD